MIMQRFFPIATLLTALLNLAFHQFENWSELNDLSFDEVDGLISSKEESLFSLLDRLASLKQDSEINSYIITLPSDKAFLLYVAIQISFLHFHADTEQLPAIPGTQTYPLLFAYLQEGYLSFKKHCQTQKLSIWESIIDYEITCDHGEQFSL